MWKPNKYFWDRAKEIADAEGVKYKKSTSGYNKGDYTASLIMPANLQGWEGITTYLLGKYGVAIKTYGQISSTDKEQAKRYLINAIKETLEDDNEKKTQQKVSEIWAYYNKTKNSGDYTTLMGYDQDYSESLAVSSWENQIGHNLLDYFRILDGTINPDNWRDYQYAGNGMTKIGGVTNFKELYFTLKNNAREEHLKGNTRLNQDIKYQQVKQFDSYVFDEENISEIAAFENKLEGKAETKPEPKTKNEFKYIDNKTVLKWIGNNIPSPVRGTIYTNEQISQIISVAWTFEQLNFKNNKNTLMIYWRGMVYDWQSQMLNKLGDKLFVKIFGNENIDFTQQWVNEYKLKAWHPLNHALTSSYFKDTDGILCKYGTCNFSQKDYWTYDNVVKSFKESILKIDTGLVDYLNYISDKQMYDGSIELKEWIDAYAKGMPTHFKAHILKNIYALECDYQNVDEVIRAYLKDYKEKKEEPKKEVQPVIEPAAKQPEISGKIKISDLFNVKPENDKGFVKVGYRKAEFLNTSILLGRERVIILASGETHKSVFALVELDDIIASHNEKTYNDTENYPVNEKGGNINDRNYKDDKNSQQKVRQMAERFTPDIQISTSASAAGLPVITVDGVVVSGNNRIMSMKLMESDYNANYKNYLKTLGREIKYGGYGLSDHVGIAVSYIGNDIDDKFMRQIALEGSSYNNPMHIEFTKPILVRIDLDFPEYNTMEMAKYNKDTKKVKRPIDKAIELGKILEANEGCFNGISEIIGRFDNISDFYVSKVDVHDIKNYLVSCNILTENELPSYIDSGVFTNQGKEFLENLMAGMILGKEQLIASEMDGVKRLKQTIVQSLPVLIKNSKYKDFSLKQYINDAIIIQEKLVASKLSMIDYVAQLQMFQEQAEIFPDKSFYMNLLLNSGKIKFKKAIETYNNSAEQNIGGSMFGEAISIDEMFNKLIVPQLEPKEVAAIRKHFGEPEKQQEVIEQKADAVVEPVRELSKEEATKMLRGLEIAYKHKPSENIEAKIRSMKLILEN